MCGHDHKPDTEGCQMSSKPCRNCRHGVCGHQRHHHNSESGYTPRLQTVQGKSGGSRRIVRCAPFPPCRKANPETDASGRILQHFHSRSKWSAPMLPRSPLFSHRRRKPQQKALQTGLYIIFSYSPKLRRRKNRNNVEKIVEIFGKLWEKVEKSLYFCKTQNNEEK